MPPTEGRDALIPTEGVEYPLRLSLAVRINPSAWRPLNDELVAREPGGWWANMRKQSLELADELLAEIERGHVIVPADMLREVKAWADHFAPCVADDNNWYRDECPMDGKDAASLGELLAVLAGDGEPRP